ncbi:transcriptional regulator, XRE family [Candidatus Koribacter versatilis Ellin345]|uniref:Transcriptional regulator, XRE family n=1 Tax=Koribacter versatilis (strain Ellin345) TaxID=204669 RepID=Q1IHT0_KORVE|nr:helix-turn-helix transcriptional regulator [Candidatus Koribacter versatilis]ABF43570.1 transcriptional regulator, XRE family [Candidatus Koribacter versatilis Ellin345]
MEYIFKNIGSLIRAERLRRGLTQTELASHVRMPQSQLSRIEKGANVSLSTLAEISRALDLEPMLIPKRLLPAVNHIIGYTTSGDPEAQRPPSLVSHEED